VVLVSIGVISVYYAVLVWFQCIRSVGVVGSVVVVVWRVPR
jgi:hypothetical protein